MVNEEKHLVESKVEEFLNMLNDLLQSLKNISGVGMQIQEIQNVLINSLEKQYTESSHYLKNAINEVVWDRLVIAFFGETNAGKSTIIETFRIQFDEKTRQAQIDAYGDVDGEIVGNGEMDFTKDFVKYDLSIYDKPFTLIDVPGIEGNESVYIDKIREALAQAHIVFYVQGQNKQPDEGTASKIKDFLQDWINVYSIFNVRGGVGNYNKEDERTTLLTDSIIKTEKLIIDKFQKVLGNTYKGNITLQGLLALCAVAKFSPARKDLIRKQNRLFEFFVEKDDILKFSKIQDLIDLVDDKSLNFTQEIVEANKQKLIAKAKLVLYDLSKILSEQEYKITKYRNNLKKYKNEIDNVFTKNKNLIETRVYHTNEAAFNSLKNSLYFTYDNKKSNKEFNSIAKLECNKTNLQVGENVRSEIIKISKELEQSVLGKTKELLENIPEITFNSLDVDLNNFTEFDEIPVLSNSFKSITIETLNFSSYVIKYSNAGKKFNSKYGQIVGAGVGTVAWALNYSLNKGEKKAKQKKIIEEKINNHKIKREKIYKENLISPIFKNLDDKKSIFLKKIDEAESGLSEIENAVNTKKISIENFIKKLKNKEYGGGLYKLIDVLNEGKELGLNIDEMSSQIQRIVNF
ncbi:GTPase [Ornithobacterium rhinotracheale]|uniref:GTPase n=1 Tax=Ornithobacterium rhinotracheale TaxID=28251 RepID=UPI001FF36592|nr:GTPase [Ornithobacterium rhinotracheale]MCK0205597.1 GTPase domain-containing protein [Ornithobacterium rhinotracheale]